MGQVASRETLGYGEVVLGPVMVDEMSRVGPIYRLADIFGRYRYRYRYIGIGKWDIGIGHIGIGICIG